VRKRAESGKRFLHGKVGVFAATIIATVPSQPAFDVPAFDDEARVAQSAALHDQSPDVKSRGGHIA
jgi:hypothetical protein